MRSFSRWISNRKQMRFVIPLLSLVFLMALAADVEARGRGGGGRGGVRGGGGGGFGHRGGAGGGYGGRGGISRGGPARGGSIRTGRGGGQHRSSQGRRTRSSRNGESRTREGSFENRRGETVDYSGTVTRTENGLEREGSWTSTSGASGAGSGKIEIDNGKVQGTERSRHAENADGETINRDIQSDRHGDHMDREGKITSSTGIDADSRGVIKKTDDGFVARGSVVGKDGAAAGSIVRKGGTTRIRGVAGNGDRVTWGGANCRGSHCYGGRVSVDRNYYYGHPYYYYPYYYGWYSCSYGSVQTWHGAYGTPIYGCSNVVVVQTTISLGVSESSGSSTSLAPATAWPKEAAVSSAPVLMFEATPDVSVYATTYEPKGVYSVKQGDRYFWTPGPSKKSAEAKKFSNEAADSETPTANSTVITYEVGDEIVYLTNEAPLPEFYSERADHLYVWIPGVRQPTDEDRALIATVIEAQKAGGKNALDREVRKLENGKKPPPEPAAS